MCSTLLAAYSHPSTPFFNHLRFLDYSSSSISRSSDSEEVLTTPSLIDREQHCSLARGLQDLKKEQQCIFGVSMILQLLSGKFNVLSL
jgi:hypothetical protein